MRPNQAFDKTKARYLYIQVSPGLQHLWNGKSCGETAGRLSCRRQGDVPNETGDYGLTATVTCPQDLGYAAEITSGGPGSHDGGCCV